MHLVQLLLPLYAADGQRQPRSQFQRVHQELVDRFGGLTAYSRAPAEGLWDEGGDRVVRDDIVVCEVMVDDLDAGWWGAYRQDQERRFAQQEIVVRALPAQRP